MNNSFLRSLTLVVLVAVFLIGSASLANAVEPKLDDDWHFTLVPYLWLPSVNGKMNINLPHAPGSNDFILVRPTVWTISLSPQCSPWSWRRATGPF